MLPKKKKKWQGIFQNSLTTPFLVNPRTSQTSFIRWNFSGSTEQVIRSDKNRPWFQKGRPCCTSMLSSQPVLSLVSCMKQSTGIWLDDSCSHELTMSEFRKLLCSTRLSSQLIKWRQTESIIIILCSCGAFSVSYSISVFFTLEIKKRWTTSIFSELQSQGSDHPRDKTEKFRIRNTKPPY